jgi:hypothetical protein
MRERASEERREQVSRSGWRHGMVALPRTAIRPEADAIGASALMRDSLPHTKDAWLSAPMTKADADGLRLLPNRALSSLQRFSDFSGRGF